MLVTAVTYLVVVILVLEAVAVIFMIDKPLLPIDRADAVVDLAFIGAVVWLLLRGVA